MYQQQVVYQQQPMMMQQHQQPVVMMQQQQQPVVMMQQQPMYGQPQVIVQQQPMMQPIQPTIQLVQQPQQQVLIQQQQPMVMNPGMGGMSGMGGMMGQPEMSGDQQGLKTAFDYLKRSGPITLKLAGDNYEDKSGFVFDVQDSGQHIICQLRVKDHHNLTLNLQNDPKSVILSVQQGSITLNNPENFQRTPLGTISNAEGSCNSYSYFAEASGNKAVSLENLQWSWLACCLCSVVYILYFKACADMHVVSLKNSNGEVIGTGKFQTDEARSYQLIELQMPDDLNTKLLSILLAGKYMLDYCNKLKDGELEI